MILRLRNPAVAAAGLLTVAVVLVFVTGRGRIASSAVAASPDAGASPHLQIGLWGSGLDILRQVMLPAAPRGAEGLAQVVDFVYCGPGSDEHEGRLLTLLVPESAARRRHLPALSDSDCQAQAGAVAGRVVAAERQAWAAVVPATLRWTPWALEVIAEKGSLSTEAGQSDAPLGSVLGALEGRPMFEALRTRAIPVSISEQEDILIDLSVSFRGDSLIVTGYVSNSLSDADAEGPAPYLGDRLAARGVPANAAITFSETWANTLLLEAAPLTVATPQGTIGFSHPRITAFEDEIVVQTTSTSDHGEYTVTLRATGADLHVQTVQVAATLEKCEELPANQRLACNQRNIRRRGLAVVAGQLLTQDWQGVAIRPSTERAVALRVGQRRIGTFATVVRSSSAPGALTLYAGLAQEFAP